MKRIFTIFLIMLLPVAGFSQRDWSQVSVKTTEIAPDLFRLFVGDGVAVVAWVGEDGLLVIDAAYEQTAPQLMEAIEKLSDAPIRYLVNTHLHGDHTGGNVELGRNADIIAHPLVKEYLSSERRQGEQTIPPFPEHAIPNITFTDRLNLDFNGQILEMTHLPGGHTGGDIIIWFPDSKVLFMGDLLFAGYFPFVDVNNGGHPQGFMDNLAWVLENFPEETTLIGGHGPVFSMQELEAYHQDLLKTMEVVKNAREKGMSQEEMKKERILKQWEEYGTFFITEDRWIETIYPFL